MMAPGMVFPFCGSAFMVYLVEGLKSLRLYGYGLNSIAQAIVRTCLLENAWK